MSENEDPLWIGNVQREGARVGFSVERDLASLIPEPLLGPPHPTPQFSSGELEAMGMVGLYAKTANDRNRYFWNVINSSHASQN